MDSFGLRFYCLPFRALSILKTELLNFTGQNHYDINST